MCFLLVFNTFVACLRAHANILVTCIGLWSTLFRSIFHCPNICNFSDGLVDVHSTYTYTSEYFLAHLSRRLTCELIGYPWIRRPSSSSVRPSVRRPFTLSNVFSSETAWPIKAKFYVEPPCEGGTKVCINGPGHMTKMATMPI